MLGGILDFPPISSNIWSVLGQAIQQPITLKEHCIFFYVLKIYNQFYDSLTCNEDNDTPAIDTAPLLACNRTI